MDRYTLFGIAQLGAATVNANDDAAFVMATDSAKKLHSDDARPHGAT